MQVSKSTIVNLEDTYNTQLSVEGETVTITQAYTVEGSEPVLASVTIALSSLRDGLKAFGRAKSAAPRSKRTKKNPPASKIETAPQASA